MKVTIEKAQKYNRLRCIDYGKDDRPNLDATRQQHGQSKLKVETDPFDRSEMIPRVLLCIVYVDIMIL